MHEFNQLTALVTGASSGLGVDFARQLAKSGANLVLLARREAELVSIADEIKQQYDCKVTIIVQDLNEPGAVQIVLDKLQSANISIDILINNAGFGLFGEFLEIPLEKTLSMLNLDMLVVTELTHRLAKIMKEKERGYILNVASIGGYQATPAYAAYSAAKAYVLLLTEALNHEFKAYSINMSALAPGITATEFLEVSGQKTTLYQKLLMMKSEDVVQIGLKALLKNKPSVVSGLVNKLTIWSNRLVPRRLQSIIAYKLMKN